MRILLLEDQGSVSGYLLPLLEARGHEVLLAQSIPDAESHLESASLDCMVLDLNLSANGLPGQHIAATRYGLLTGWIWLKERVLESKPGLRGAVILYSDYLDELEKWVDREQLRGVKLLPKRRDDSLERLLEFIDRIGRDKPRTE